jgi:phospho-N-acetylmuramoyl-pentapeptide-transferase
MSFLRAPTARRTPISRVRSVTVLSNVMQVASKRLRGKKIFRIAPLHHHFEAIGWPAYKVTMRYWIISIICAIIGMTIALLKPV